MALVDAEQQQPDLRDVAFAQQQPQQPEREQPAVGPLQRLVDVRHRDDARDHLPSTSAQTVQRGSKIGFISVAMRRNSSAVGATKPQLRSHAAQ